MTDRYRILAETDLIKNTLRHFLEGASIEDIENKTSLNLSRRTLQRRLRWLQKNGEISIQGNTQSARYFLNFEKKDIKNEDISPKLETIPLSKDGENLLKLVKRPLHHRIPVGYNTDFLNLYIPNIQSYLSHDEKEKLLNMGKTNQSYQIAGTYNKEILSRLLIDLSWNSSRLEGNTYSLLDTQRLIAFGEMAENKSTTEAQMILNHKEAIEFLTESIDGIGFNRYTVLNVHALLSNNLLSDPNASGRLRMIDVGIHHSVYIPLGIPQKITELFDTILEKANTIKNPFEQAFFLMVHLPYLQPFDDVNKRVSRLIANIPFIHNNLTPLSFIDVPDDIYIHGMIGVYELNRIDLLKDVFIWAYERSSARYKALRQSLGEPDPFRFKYRDQIKSLISYIVKSSIKAKDVPHIIRTKAESFPSIDQQKFIESVEIELLSLHEGNFARYKIRPSEFKKWKNEWQ